MRKNILLITLDQFRGDSLGRVGHPVVQTPALDHLAANGTLLTRHYSQSSPCAPGRASLYTGLYQMNHRVLANGTPLDNAFDNVARMAVRNGYAPALFGYTDQSVDPRVTLSPDDPRLLSYEGVLPGFELVLELSKYSCNGCRSSAGAIGIGTVSGSYIVANSPAAEYGGCGRKKLR